MKPETREFETGIVTEQQNGNATVELNTQSACENCGARVVCVPDDKGKRLLRVANPLNARTGNQVEIGESSDFLLKISAIQYGIPFLGFITGIVILNILNLPTGKIPPELLLFAGGMSGLAISAVISRYLAQRLAHKKNTIFTITKILR
jgi:positive regulator of sigma E activity